MFAHSRFTSRTSNLKNGRLLTGNVGWETYDKRRSRTKYRDSTKEARNYAKLPNITKEHAKAAAVPSESQHRTPHHLLGYCSRRWTPWSPGYVYPLENQEVGYYVIVQSVHGEPKRKRPKLVGILVSLDCCATRS
ncbi:hypothetical protein K0M31_008755 [Melipona bicolor]|uniref:Uncharacterized protein n=1 Tax=Melipona bicolor TaxID=60889 RepID=A0AA40KK90_9HYME|nr:hypothetical protein K0M31_008755 [Melipona bicolor]